jgi:hypothetical protein
MYANRLAGGENAVSGKGWSGGRILGFSILAKQLWLVMKSDLAAFKQRDALEHCFVVLKYRKQRLMKHLK